MLDKLTRLGSGDLAVLSEMITNVTAGLTPALQELRDKSKDNNELLNPPNIAAQVRQGKDNDNYRAPDLSPQPGR